MVGGSRLRALRMDVGPFREHRDCRLLLIAGTGCSLGGRICSTARDMIGEDTVRVLV